SKVTWAWNALRLGPVNFRAASLNDAITSSVRTSIIPSLGPALESETTTEGRRTENSNHAETILRGFPYDGRTRAASVRANMQFLLGEKTLEQFQATAMHTFNI